MRDEKATEMRTVEFDIDPRGGIIAIVASEYHRDVCGPMTEAAIATLTAAGVPADDIETVRVPGAWELVVGTQIALSRGGVAAVIAIGCVIRGDTTHDEHINRAVSLGLMELQISNDVPIGFGLLTCNDKQQALDRAGGRVGNKGEECAAAVLKMLALAGRGPAAGDG